MALPEPENTKIDHAKLDSGIHIRDSEAAQASLWQVFITALVVVAILTVFFYGVTEQRNEDGVAQIAGAQPSQQSNVASPAGADQQTANSGKANTEARAPAVKQAPTSATTGAAPTLK